MHFLRVEKDFLMLLKAKYFQLKLKVNVFSDKVSEHTNLKKLTPKQMLQRLAKALAQLKAGTTSENLLNGLRVIIYSLYPAK